MLLSVSLATVFATLALGSPIVEPFNWYHWHHPHRPHHRPTGTGLPIFPTGTGFPTNTAGFIVANSTGLYPTGTRPACSGTFPTSLPVLAPESSSIALPITSAMVSAIPISISTPLSTATPTPVTTSSRTFTRRPRPSTTSTPVQAPTTSAAPAPTPSTPGTSDGSPLSGGVSLLTTINKYRTRYNVNTLKWSAQLEANAQKTGNDDGGVNEVHELNPGSFAQVISPGSPSYPSSTNLDGDTPFELTYVAWLCEVATDPELSEGGIKQCDLVQNILHMEYGGTGHHDILTSTSYNTIGCAFTQNPNAQTGSPYQGLWICDLGF